MRSNKISSDISWRIPYYVIVQIIIFLLVNILTITKIRGVADKEGYLWNNAKYIPINTYEDDGRFNIYAALGYKGFSERHEYLINIGGPYIHIARFILWAGNKIGIVRIFDDPNTYFYHPQQYLKIWKFFGLYKVWIFLIWMPIVMYWIGARHFSKVTGIIASWLIVAMPFITGFEPRIKADSVAIVLGLFSVLFQLEYIKNYKIRYLLISAFFLGFSFSVKFNMFPAIITLIIVYVKGMKMQNQRFFAYATWRKLMFAFMILFTTFIITNPLIVVGMISYIKRLSQFVKLTQVQSTINITSIITSIWYRIIHFDSFYGITLNYLVIPSLVFPCVSVFYSKNHRDFSRTIIFIFIIAYFLFMAFVVGKNIIYLTYFYYAAAVMMILIISDFLANVYYKLISISRVYQFIIGLSIFYIIAATGYENGKVLKYMTSTTNRQDMHMWFEKNIHRGAIVGIPISPTHNFFNQWVRIDPFKYRLVYIGEHADRLEDNKPEYLIWIIFSKDSSIISDQNYTLIAEFSKGVNLPHERYDLYQEEVFQVYRRINSLPDISQRNILGEMECELGKEMRKDKEGEFRILQYQSISFMPLWLNLMRKKGDSIDYDSHMSFEKCIKGVGPHDFKYSHVGNIGATTLQLWGVKYILAKLSPGLSFEEQILNSGHYNLKEIRKYKTIFGNEKRDVGLYYNNEYMGQIFFAKYGEKRRLELKKGETRGVLYDIDELKKLNTNNIAISMEIKTTTPSNIIIKGGGNEESWYINNGKQVIWMPYRIFNHDEQVLYEINPIQNSGQINVKGVDVLPLSLYGKPFVDCIKITRESMSATINTDFDGEVIFSLPYDKYWEARVDRKRVHFKRGLAGTIAAEIKKGRHFAEIQYK